jgi:ABC-2 type transport system ATP-binding protein
MLEIRHLVKHFGPLKAVDDISFTVPRGEVLGFLGPNGAGKSTTMKMITGFVAPTAGTAIVCGHDITTHPIAAKKRIGYLPEGAPAYPDMTPADFLDFIAHIRGFAGAEAKSRIGRVVEMIRIAGVLHQPIETLSKGFKRRVGVAQALLHDPEVLILDEPTDGLDPNQKYEMRRIIGAMRPEKVIIISTHLLEEVEAVCSRAIIIAHGRILADATPAPNARAITTPYGLAYPLVPSRRFAPS